MEKGSTCHRNAEVVGNSVVRVCSIVVPMRDEAPIIATALNHLKKSIEGAKTCHTEWQVIVVDGGSRDGGAQIAQSECDRFGWTYLDAPRSRPSVGRTIVGARSAVTGQTVLVLPADCLIGSAALTELASCLEREGEHAGAFPKCYQPDTPLLRLYAKGQNEIRLKYGRHAVWTNALFFPVSFLSMIVEPDHGFLEDVSLCDRLRQNRWTTMREPVTVSSRRYFPGRVFRRIVLNFSILILHRLNWVEPARLRKFYLALS